MSVVQEVESGQMGIKVTQGKYGIQGDDTIRTWKIKSHYPMTKTLEQKLLELEKKYGCWKNKKQL